MKLNHKPVRKCRRCLLNMDDHCWAYPCPRRQWSRKTCPGFENEKLYQEFKAWMDKPRVVTRRQLRREMSRSSARNRRLKFSFRRSIK